jgi:hypothetical protein
MNGDLWASWGLVENFGTSYSANKPKWRVSCYLEDENEKTIKIIEETNNKLKLLANEN